MPPSEIEHDDAVKELLSEPQNPENAQRVFELAREDPGGARQAREKHGPTPRLLPLDIVRKPFRRNNLVMQQTPKRVAQPRTRGELLGQLQAAASERSFVKAIGDGYGFANTGETRGSLIPTVGRLNRILRIDPAELKSGTDVTRLCRFEAGATIEALNDHLWKVGKALLNQPGYEKLTYVGTMSSGGHGSGIWCGPLSEHVRALHLVTIDENRKVVEFQVEPANGISDPSGFVRTNPGIELVQDDRLFHACTVGMGCLGVIYAATIEVREAYNIRETRRKYRLEDVMARLPQLLAEQGPGKRLHSIEIWVNPYPVRGTVWCILGERAETNEPPRGQRAFVIEYGGPEFLYHLLAWWMENAPDALPGLVDAAMTATQAADVVMPATKGLNFGAPNLAPVTACACGVAASEIAAVTESLVKFFQKRAREKRAYVTSPIGLRFVKAAKAHLSPAFGRDTCMIEVPTLLRTPHARETLAACHDFLFQEYGGRPHWGQVNDMPGSRLDAMYPSLNAFMEAFRVLNPKGFLDNAFTEQMGFRSRPA